VCVCVWSVHCLILSTENGNSTASQLNR